MDIIEETIKAILNENKNITSAIVTTDNKAQLKQQLDNKYNEFYKDPNNKTIHIVSARKQIMNDLGLDYKVFSGDATKRREVNANPNYLLWGSNAGYDELFKIKVR